MDKLCRHMKNVQVDSILWTTIVHSAHSTTWARDLRPLYQAMRYVLALNAGRWKNWHHCGWLHCICRRKNCLWPKLNFCQILSACVHKKKSKLSHGLLVCWVIVFPLQCAFAHRICICIVCEFGQSKRFLLCFAK